MGNTRDTSPRSRRRWLVAVGLATAAALATGAAATAVEGQVTALTASEAGQVVADVNDQLAAAGFSGEVSGVPGVLVFTGATTDASLGPVTMTTFEGSVEDYAADYLARRTSFLEEPGDVALASVWVGDGLAYGSSGDTVFAAEWAAVQRGDSALLVIRRVHPGMSWLEEELVDAVALLAPSVEAAGFVPEATFGFSLEGAATTDNS